MRWTKSDFVKWGGGLSSMIFFGTRGVTSTSDRGEFFCPSCNSNQPFARKRIRRFFTLYFIPLIPLDNLSEYIECQSCEDTFKENVLDYNPEESAAKIDAEYRIAIRRVMALITLADGVVDDAEIENMISINEQVTGQTISAKDMRDEVNAAQHESLSLTDTIAHVEPFLNNHGKELVVKAAYLVAMADGVFQDEEQKLLIEIGAGLNLTSAHLKGILGEMNSH
jgi:tellurite resistance protein